MILSLMESCVTICFIVSNLRLTSNKFTQDLREVYASRLGLADQMEPNSVIIRAWGLGRPK
jgi:hypothetical protein